MQKMRRQICFTARAKLHKDVGVLSKHQMVLVSGEAVFVC